MTGLPPLPGVAGGRGGGPNIGGYQLMESTHPRANGQRRDVALRRHRYESFRAGAVCRTQSARRVDGRNRRDRRWRPSARSTRFDDGNDAGTAAPIEAGLAAVRALRAQLASLATERLRAVRDRFPSEDQRARLRRRRPRRPWPDVRCGSRRRPGDRRPAGEAVAGGREPGRVGCQRDRASRSPASMRRAAARRAP